ncbi:hypothetical protein HYC85_010314 [Camellia sinensis]|uniref:Uncharacterized protein n=1 Tax=Camellia sinensis TaxID=4442 RepID=A0A7J7HHJ9_CAMSI|nr:hypothetical protein HYC85_010314 [Camellia sinensis]
MPGKHREGFYQRFFLLLLLYFSQDLRNTKKSLFFFFCSASDAIEKGTTLPIRPPSLGDWGLKFKLLDGSFHLAQWACEISCQLVEDLPHSGVLLLKSSNHGEIEDLSPFPTYRSAVRAQKVAWGTIFKAIAELSFVKTIGSGCRMHWGNTLQIFFGDFPPSPRLLQFFFGDYPPSPRLVFFSDKLHESINGSISSMSQPQLVDLAKHNIQQVLDMLQADRTRNQRKIQGEDENGFNEKLTSAISYCKDSKCRVSEHQFQLHDAVEISKYENLEAPSYSWNGIGDTSFETEDPVSE